MTSTDIRVVCVCVLGAERLFPTVTNEQQWSELEWSG